MTGEAGGLEAVTDQDRRDVAKWLTEQADYRVKVFPQRRDGIDALMRHLAADALRGGGDEVTDVAEVLAAHAGLAHGPSQIVCACNQTWMTYEEHRAHVAEQIQPLIDAEKQRAVEEALDEVRAVGAYLCTCGQCGKLPHTYLCPTRLLGKRLDPPPGPPSRIHRGGVVSIEELRALEAAATPGPWIQEGANYGRPSRNVRAQHQQGWPLQGVAYDVSRTDDAAFIAAARNVLPDLLDRLERAERQVVAAEALADVWSGRRGLLHHGVATDRLRAALATEEPT